MLLVTGLVSPSGPLIVAFVLGLIQLFGVLALLTLKMAMSGGLVVIFVGMPIFSALWVVPYLGFIARMAGKFFVIILIIPGLWSIIFVVFTGLSVDTLTFGNHTLHEAGWWGTLLRPLMTITLLLMLVKLPTKLATLGWLSGLLPGGNEPGAGGKAAH